MSRKQDNPNLFHKLQNNKSVNAFRSFVATKVRNLSNNIKPKRKTRWQDGIKRKKRENYHSPLNLQRRRQTKNWGTGGIYAPKERKNKIILQPKQEGKEFIQIGKKSFN